MKLLDVREKSEIKELIFTYELMNGYISLGDFIYQAFDKLTPSKIKFIGFHLARGLCFL